jgi:hypothetical protein
MPTRPATSLMRSGRAARRFADARFADTFDEFFLLDTGGGFL